MLYVADIAEIETPDCFDAAATACAASSLISSGNEERPEHAILYCTDANPAAAASAITFADVVPAKVLAKIPMRILR